MKKIYALMLGTMLSGTSAFSQFTDNFDSYTAGGYLGVQSGPWTTWSGTQGGAEDVQITTVNASSAPNSIYFSSTSANGGPQDVVLSFGGVKNTGQFSIGADFFVESGKGAYFNLQADASIGSTWAIDCQMVNDGNLYLYNTQGTYISTTYPTNTWFELRLDINLNTNVWELFIDNVSQGNFANPINRVSFLDIFPVNPTSGGGNNICGFYIDDFFYTHTPYTLSAVNGAVTLASVSGGLAGQSREVVATVRNLGNNAITSFDLNYTYDGANITENITGVNITSLSTYDYTFNQDIVLATGSNPLVVTISNVNGSSSDGDPSDDQKTLLLNPVVPAPGKIVVAEEGTGTWCGWCPRGAVFMEELSTKYQGYFAGIAVHNGDPMVVSDYDAAIGALIGGYPSALIDRGAEIDPSQMEPDFLDRIVLAPAATLNVGGNYNSGSGALTVDVTTTFNINTSGDWRLLVVLTEDGVTGTGSGYNQTNYYAGGGNGVMGGYEVLANPVPAALMVYDHVARDIDPSFTGLQNAFAGTIVSGDVFNNSFNFTINPAWDINSMHAIAILRHPNGTIENAGELMLGSLVGISENENTFAVNIFPNPSDEMTNISIELENTSEVVVDIVDINGKTVESRSYGVLNGSYQLPVRTSGMAAGIYLVRISAGDQSVTRKLIVE